MVVIGGRADGRLSNFWRRGADTLLAVAGLVLLATTVGCTDQGALVVHYQNETAEVLDVFVLYPDTGVQGELQADIRPGETSITRGDVYPGAACSERGVLIARDQSGHEVARRSGRLCPDDTWEIIEGQVTG